MAKLHVLAWSGESGETLDDHITLESDSGMVTDSGYVQFALGDKLQGDPRSIHVWIHINDLLEAVKIASQEKFPDDDPQLEAEFKAIDEGKTQR